MGFFKDKTEKLMREISKLEATEFLGVCKILGIRLYSIDKDKEEVECTERPSQENDQIHGEPRDFTEIWSDLCEKVNHLNREQKRNLDKLVRAATKKGH